MRREMQLCPCLLNLWQIPVKDAEEEVTAEIDQRTMPLINCIASREQISRGKRLRRGMTISRLDAVRLLQRLTFMSLRLCKSAFRGSLPLDRVCVKKSDLPRKV
jgi:hypothetical protein